MMASRPKGRSQGCSWTLGAVSGLLVEDLEFDVGRSLGRVGEAVAVV